MKELDQSARPCFVELWPSKLVPGVLDGWLYYRDPLGQDRNDCIPITTGPQRDDVMGDGRKLLRWAWKDNGDGTGTTHPSILMGSVYHIAPGAVWVKTEANPDGSWPKTERGSK